MCWSRAQDGLSAMAKTFRHRRIDGYRDHYFQDYYRVSFFTWRAKVKDLIVLEDMLWRFELLQQLFAKEEVRYICLIPLSIRRSPNKLMWYYEKTWLFIFYSSGKSAYKVARTICASSTLKASSSFDDGGAYCGL